MALYTVALRFLFTKLWGQVQTCVSINAPMYKVSSMKTWFSNDARTQVAFLEP